MVSSADGPTTSPTLLAALANWQNVEAWLLDPIIHTQLPTEFADAFEACIPILALFVCKSD